MRSAYGLRIPVSAEVFPVIRGNQHSRGTNLNWRLVGVYFCYSVQSSRKVIPIDSYSRMRKNDLMLIFWHASQ